MKNLPTSRYGLVLSARHLLAKSIAIMLVLIAAYYGCVRWIGIEAPFSIDFFRHHIGFILAATGFLIGLFRCGRAHPSFYSEWLKTTPWQNGNPLPFESPQLQPRDLIGIIIFVSIGLALDGMWLPALAGLTIGYLITALIIIAHDDIRATRVPFTAFVLTTPLLLVPVEGEPSTLAALAIATVSLIGLVLTQVGLSHVISDPFKDSEPRATFGKIGSPCLPSKKTDRDGSSISCVQALLLAAIVAALARALSFDQEVKFPISLSLLIVITAAFLRWSTFWGKHRPPTSLFGRISSRRFIIPKYDHMILPCLFAPIAALSTAHLAVSCGATENVAAYLSSLVGLFLIFALKPTLRQWHLTCPGREIHFNTNSKEQMIKRL